jgi:hypothetical protein
MTIPVTFLAVMSLRQELARRSLGAGVLLALAAALKPQMGLALLAVPLVRGRWKTALAAAGGLGLLGVLAAGRMALSGVHWLGLYANQVGAFVGAQADPTLANPGAYLMIDLRPLLHTVIASRLAVNVLTLAAVVPAGGLLAWWLRRSQGPRAELLLYSGAAVLGLLAFYNRAYSAAVLVLPLAWATACPGRGEVRAAAWAVIAAVLVFVLPGSAILGTLADAGRLPFDPRSPAWRATVMMHQTWALLVLAGALLLAARRQGERPCLDPPGAWKDN